METSQLNGLKILVTGHTGFKGSWLILLLQKLGAEIVGYSDEIRDTSLFSKLKDDLDIHNVVGDIRDLKSLERIVREVQPDGIFHLAAQPLVITSFLAPLETFSTNIIGTANVVLAAKHSRNLKFVLVVTTDKVYKNDDSGLPFTESSPLGGHDPYSASKSAAEIVVASLRDVMAQKSMAKIVTARAGNVIGGGDDAQYRLLPDLVRAVLEDRKPLIRNPDSTRPWQHVLDPLMGYLMTSERILSGLQTSNEYNFGPDPSASLNVDEVCRIALEFWGTNESWDVSSPDISDFPESRLLSLDSGRALQELNWQNKLSAQHSIEWTMSWERSVNLEEASAFEISNAQIEKFLAI
jgi:CDP-glucose 4,6-dehydratase